MVRDMKSHLHGTNEATQGNSVLNPVQSVDSISTSPPPHPFFSKNTPQHWSTNPLVRKKRSVLYEFCRKTGQHVPLLQSFEPKIVECGDCTSSVPQDGSPSVGIVSSSRAPADPRCETGAKLCCNLQLRQLEPSQEPDDPVTLLLWPQPTTGFPTPPFGVHRDAVVSLVNEKIRSSASVFPNTPCAEKVKNVCVMWLDVYCGSILLPNWKKRELGISISTSKIQVFFFWSSSRFLNQSIALFCNRLKAQDLTIM